MKYIHLIFIVILGVGLGVSCSKDDGGGGASGPDGSGIALQGAVDNEGSWVYVEKDNMFSRNGNTMGYVANVQTSSSSLIIFLDGGGACYNSITCAGNDDDYSASEAQDAIVDQLQSALFDRTSAFNPLKDWNYVFVPYATGDVHSGVNEDADVPNGGPADQKMVGYNNVTAVLADLEEYFTTYQAPTEIILTGSSAGSFGVYLNFIQLADRFGADIKLTGLYDSGIVFTDDNLLTPCLSSVWTDLWKFPLPADSDTYVSGTYDYDIQKMYEYQARKYPNANFGVISTYNDETMRFFYGFGRNNCNGSLSSIAGSEYKDELNELQSRLDGFDNWKVYYKNGSEHVLLPSSTTTTVNGVNLAQWILQLHDGTASDVIE